MITAFSTRKKGIWFSAAVNEESKLVACAFSDRDRNEAERAVRNSLPKKSAHPLHRRHPDKRTVRLLTTFYNGKGKRESIKIVDLSSVSSFRRKVYGLLCKIPLGKVTTYGAIAQKLGGKRYARAVGTAVATNPLPLIIPCHRVVPASLKVGNYGLCGRNPTKGGYMKRRLLEREGVRFQGPRVAERSAWVPK